MHFPLQSLPVLSDPDLLFCQRLLFVSLLTPALWLSVALPVPSVPDTAQMLPCWSSDTLSAHPDAPEETILF